LQLRRPAEISTLPNSPEIHDGRSNPTPETLLKRERERWGDRPRVSAAELAIFRSNPSEEKDREITEYVVCRECGVKVGHLAGGSTSHLRKFHQLTIRQYRDRWHGAPTISIDAQKKQRKACANWRSSDIERANKSSRESMRRTAAKIRGKLAEVDTLRAQVVEAERLRATALPADWHTKPEDWVFIGLVLRQRAYMSNDELAVCLDASGGPKCRYSEDGSWGIITRPGPAANHISKIRKWAERPGKLVVRN
jgi:hypothetical protein